MFGVGESLALVSFGLDLIGQASGGGKAGKQAYQEAYGMEMERFQMEARNRQREAMFKARLEMVDKQIDNNWEAAYDAWTSEQTRLNEVYEKAAFTSQDMLQQLAVAQGGQAAGERYGQSARRAGLVSTLGAYGRSRAQLSKQLTSERLATDRSMKLTARNLMAANDRAMASISAPDMETAATASYTDFAEPALTTALKIGQSAVGAFKAGYEMTPGGDKFFGQTKKIPTVKVAKG
jgi:hypothetical protein